MIFGFAMLLLLAWFSREPGDSDMWWHLKTGKFILTEHHLPVPDPFAWTTYLGKPAYTGEEITRYFNLTHEWLAQSLMYAAFATGGLPAIVMMRALALTLFCALAGLMAWRRTHALNRALAATLATAIALRAFTADRPQYFTYVFLAFTINLLDAGRWLWILPPLFLIWANCHGGFFLGWIAIAIYATETRFRSRKNLLPLLGAILISGLNPNGFRAIEVLQYYRHSALQSQIFEWRAPVFWELSPFTVLLYGSIIIAVLNRRKLRRPDWLLLILFGVAGLLAFRNIVFTAFVAAYVTAAWLPWWNGEIRLQECGILAVMCGAIVLVMAKHLAFQFHPSARTPVAAADFVVQHHLHGKLFNTYGQGGYLIWRLWPQMKVFTDGRALDETTARDAQRILFDADDTARTYDFDVTVMDSFEPVSGTPYYFTAALADPQQTQWKLVFWDAHDLIWMRNPPPEVKVLNSLEALDAMEAQCAFLIEDGAPNCARGMADVFARIGDSQRADKWTAISEAGHAF